MVTQQTRQKFIRVSVLAALLVFIGFLASQSFGLFTTGFESDFILTQFSFYLSGAIFLIGLLLLIYTELAISSGDKRYGDSLAFNSAGDPPSLPFRAFRNPIGLFFLSIAIFSILGLVLLFTEQTAFTEFVVIAQQFTEVESLIFSSLLIPIAENLGLAFAVALTIFGIRFTARRVKMSRNAFILTSVILVIVLSLIYGILNHTLRYGDSDINLIRVGIFWALSGFVTVLSGSFIPAWIMHITNNIIFSVNKEFALNQIAPVSVVIAIISFSIYLFIFLRFNGRRRRRR